MKVGFLFNHDAGHQAGHLAPVLNAYARLRPRHEARAYVGGPSMQATVRRGLSLDAAQRVRFVELGLPGGAREFARALDVAMPASRVARLVFNRPLFADLDALIAPERTCLILKRKLARAGVRFVHVRHGAGDRGIGFHPSFAAFDLLLLQGRKYVRRLSESGGLNGNEYALIGYPKFDGVEARERPRIFDNDRPTVLYNPHFSPEYSSWYGMGRAVLDWFADNPRYNLIFAPHVMLFKRRLHLSPQRLAAAWRRDLPARYGKLRNILIDVGGPRLFDMSYTLAADLYLGDGSSQVMEFIVRPRPCIFLNPRRLDWRSEDVFAAWRLGRVIERLDQLGPALEASLADPEEFAPLQRAHFSDTFDLTEEPSAERAACAIAAYLEGRREAVSEPARAVA